jgi:Cu-Zn family superoxide dismutase
MKQAIVEFPSEFSYSENNIKGYILFSQQSINESVIVKVYLENIPNGKHGFHVHEYAISENIIKQLKKGINIKGLCKTLGGHFNPYKTNHGSYKYNTERHVGDLINNLEVENSKVSIIFQDPLISLYLNKKNCIIGKSIVIHEEQDDEGLPGLNALIENRQLNKLQRESLITGNAGKRIACGNILELEL